MFAAAAKDVAIACMKRLRICCCFRAAADAEETFDTPSGMNEGDDLDARRCLSAAAMEALKTVPVAFARRSSCVGIRCCLHRDCSNSLASTASLSRFLCWCRICLFKEAEASVQTAGESKGPVSIISVGLGASVAKLMPNGNRCSTCG